MTFHKQILGLILLYVAAIAVANELSAQSRIFKFDKFTTEDGLSSNTTTCLTKDSLGFVWIGTIDGLNRFDGNSFKIFHPKNNDTNAISDSWINCMYDDGRILWIGTPSGLNRFDKTTELCRVYRINHGDSNSISDDFISSICKSSKDYLWVGTMNGLNRFDIGSGKFDLVKIRTGEYGTTLPTNYITALDEDNEGNLWIGTNGEGLLKYNIAATTFTQFKINPEDSSGLSGNFIQAIQTDELGNLWIATKGGGVNMLPKNSNRFIIYKNNFDELSTILGDDISAMSIHANGKHWFGIKPEGISILNDDKTTFTNIKNNISDAGAINSISHIFSDKFGIMWICTYGNGLYIYNKDKWKIEHYFSIGKGPNQLRSNEVYSICDDSAGNFWVAGKFGLQMLYKNTNKFSHIIEVPDDPKFPEKEFTVTHIFRDKSNLLWMSSEGGALRCYDPLNKTCKLYYDENGNGFYSNCIFEDRNGDLWIGSSNGGGITVFDKDRNFKKKYFTDSAGKSLYNVYDIYEDKEGYVWIASFRGVMKLDRNNGNITHFRNVIGNMNSLSNDKVTVIKEDSDGNLWISTYGGGINKFEPASGKFENYTEGEMGKDIIVGMLPDSKGNLWLSHYRGISKFDTRTKKFTNYGTGDGVQGFEFSTGAYYKSAYGQLFFGGSNGFNSFYPDSIKINMNVPSVVITNFRIFNKEAKFEKSIPVTEKIDISYKENFFSFEFAALDYTNPKKNQYAYKLEGIDEDWNYIGNSRIASYTNISPGNYVFRVKGSNNDGIWNEEGASVRLTIIPPWYRTLWFNVLAATAVILSVFFIFRQRIEKIKKEKLIKEEFTKQLIQSQENERMRLAAELHDSLGQNLSIIKNKVLLTRGHNNEMPTAAELDEISDLTTGAIEEVRSISHNLRPFEIERLGLTEAVLTIIEKTDSSTQMNVKHRIDDIDNILPPDAEIHFYRLIQESMNNIIKHSNANTVTIVINRNDSGIETLIRDNGVGFDLSHRDTAKKGMGLAGLNERVNIMRGNITVNSEKGSGTEIKFEIPITNNGKKV